MFLVSIPPTFIEERKYVVRAIFSVLGLTNELIVNDSVTDYIIECRNTRDKKLIINDSFFAFKANQWLGLGSLPEQPLENFEVCRDILKGAIISNSVPVIYGKCCDDQVLTNFECNQSLSLNIDIFGSAFFMLTRYEELVKPERDEHGRFPAVASLAYQEGFLDRPIINEYIEILWRCMHYLWPGLKRKERQFRLVPSHDVDLPFQYAFLSLTSNVRACAGDVIKRKNPSLAMNRLLDWMAVKKGKPGRDPLNCFDLIMDISEQHNLLSCFYFMTGGESSFDGEYQFAHHYIKALVQNIKNRGHQIGLHPSYESYRNRSLIKMEYERLRKTCSELGIEQDLWGGRQHYLRWEVPQTWQYYADANLDYDTTLSYADQPGFRCGFCYEYPVFNLLTRKELNLNERPLIAMEASLLREDFMSLDHNNAFSLYKTLINQCKKYCGDFNMLWHNTSIANEAGLALYKNVINYASE